LEEKIDQAMRINKVEGSYVDIIKDLNFKKLVGIIGQNKELEITQVN